MLTIDNREHELIALLTAMKVPHAVEMLPVGDIWIQGPQGPSTQGPQGPSTQGTQESQALYSIVIERKSIRDLEASILDGRYREQRGRILAHCQSAGQPIYLLEGSLSHTRTLPASALMKHISRLTLRYQIPVLHTSSVQETAQYVQALWEQWQEDPTALQRTTELVKVSDGIHVQKKANASQTFAVGALAQCPGVSVKIAEAILAAQGSLRGVMDATPEAIAEIKVGAKRIGPAVAKRLSEMLNQA